MNEHDSTFKDTELIQLSMINNAKRARNHLKNNNVEMASYYINKIIHMEEVGNDEQ